MFDTQEKMISSEKFIFCGFWLVRYVTRTLWLGVCVQMPTDSPLLRTLYLVSINTINWQKRNECPRTIHSGRYDTGYALASMYPPHHEYVNI